MPSTSKKQKKFMRACKHNRKGMRGKCPPEKVVDEFVSADNAKSARRRA